ncbi:MAG: hypothetical protein HFI90_01845 [Clostridia bacterium]|nr:hypothetical protein [Clostridia bacterium]
MMKKWIVFGVLICMLLGCLPSAAAAGNMVVADLTQMTVCQDAGLPASGEYVKSGNYTMKWAGSDLFRNISIKTQRQDLSAGNYLEVWVYSKTKSDGRFTIAMISDDSSTVCTDYYYTTVTANWAGWKLLSLKYTGEDSDFQVESKPVGLENISEIRLWPNYGGASMKEDAALYFDKITCSAEKGESGSAGETTGNIYMIGDFSKEENVAKTGFPSSSEQTLSGEVTLKWAGAFLEKAPKMTAPTDWTPYTTLVMDIYSEKNTGSTFRIAAISDNPETDGQDYYMSSFAVDWTGWKKLVLVTGEEASDFTKSRTPLGWNQISDVIFWPVYGGVGPDPSTVLYIDKIYLTDQEVEKPVFNNDTDYILPSQTKPDFEDAVGLIKQNHPNQSHPRLLLNAQDFENLKELVKTEPYLMRTYQSVMATADAALKADVLTYGTPDGKRLPRTAPNMMPPLAMAYKLTGETKYKDRLWQELEAVSAFPDWNPSHFLDVGDFARGMAYAYDWLYDDWTPQQRRIMRNAMVRHGFGPSINLLRGKSGFAGQVNNWNEVINSGLGLAALAFGDEPGYEELCNEVINLTVDSLPIGLAPFAPDGACPEGPGYWNYAMETFFQYNSAMFTAMETDFGLTQMEGIGKTGYFPVSLMGPTGQTFNFADGGAGAVRNGVFFWIAQLFDQPELGGYQMETGTTGTWADLAMYRPDERQKDFSKNMPLDNIFRGEQEIATLRNSWADKNALYVAFKGGSNQASHCDLDMGDFVIDALGVRWICEMGAEYYEAPGMWDFGADGGRWLYYRKNPEGQNTLVINPTDKVAQNVYATAPIETYETSDAAAYGIVDLTEAYKDYAREVKRGVGLVNNRGTVLVQDEIKTMSPSEIYSFFHTTADIEIANSKTAFLKINNKKMRVDLLSKDGSFEAMDAAPLPTSKQPDYPQMDNSGTRKLAVHLLNAVNPTISVMFTPVVEGQPEGQLPTVLPLSNWEQYKNGSAALTSLAVDGIPVNGFSPYNLLYRVSTGISGKVTATADADIAIDIRQAEGDESAAFVTAKSKSTGLQSIYSVSFEAYEPSLFTKGVRKYEIKSVKASAVPEAVNIPDNTIDGDYDTKWAAEGEEWIEWDLGEPKQIDTVSLAFMNGDTRIAKFRLETSQDGSMFTPVFEGTSSGTTNYLEPYSFPKTTARYIRFVNLGNSVNNWVSLTEVNIPEIVERFADAANHWASEDIQLFNTLGIVNGVSATEFAPENPVTRAEFLAMVTRIASMSPGSTYQNQFSDVAADAWYAGNVQAAMEQGILPAEMVQDGMFKPEQSITREEMVSIIVKTYAAITGLNTASASLDGFTDAASISDYAKPYVQQALALHIVKGLSENMFGPKEHATRAETVVIVKRLATQILE